MTKTKLPRPTDAELDILRVLWSQGPSTVRDVHSALEKERSIGYTTVLKLRQIMAERGLVERDQRERAGEQVVF
jgi:BlaI family transcriptional regulator, penicillinase repressor